MKPTSETRKPYTGSTRSLVVALDVGTTFSGVSYAILEPDDIPKIHGVTRFPGQEHVAGNSKIPTIMYYDREGKMMAAGAEADTPSMLSLAEDEGWIKVELFKLRLRPRTMKLSMNGMRLGPLPYRKSAVDVFGDFLSYLFLCTRNFIRDTHANGASLWKAVEHDIQFVLSHPNGWEGAQQTKMRRAAVYGGLIPDTNEGKARIRFVTEGEASLHACVLNGLADDVLSGPAKSGFLVLDAGGGTLDISSYTIRAQSPLVIEEVAPPDCVFAGSVFVSRRARELFQDKLKNSKYGTPDAVDHITKRFDETTKRLFRDKKDAQYILFGSPLDKDPSVGIRNGQLRLSGAEVADLFEPSIQSAVHAIKAQVEASHRMIKSVFLVGGYANSAWLFSQLQERLEPYRVSVSRPDTQTSKAVADGAIGFYCDHHVSARMSKFMYGVEFLRQFDASDPEHVERKDRLCELPSGPRLLPDAFDCILARGVKVKESMVFTRKYCTELTSLSLLSVFEVEIWCYRGGNVIPKWIMRQADDFSTLCLVRADLSLLSSSAEAKTGKHGRVYWNIVFSVEIHFGLTEFKARIKWVDNGATKYGPASIIYNERGHRLDEDEPDSYPEDDMTPAQSQAAKSLPVSRARSVDSTTFQTPAVSASNSKRSSILGPSRNEPPPAPSAIPEVVAVASTAPSIRTTTATSVRSTSRIPSISRAPTEFGTGVSTVSRAPVEVGTGYSAVSRAPTEVGSRVGDLSRDSSRGRSTHKGKERAIPSPSTDDSGGTGNISNRTSRLADTLSSVWGAVSPAAKSIAESFKSKETSPLSSPVKRELREILQSPPAVVPEAAQPAIAPETPVLEVPGSFEEGAASVLGRVDHREIEPSGEAAAWGSFTSAGEATGAPTDLKIETSFSNRAASAVISPLPEMNLDSGPQPPALSSSNEFSDLLSASANPKSLNDMLGTPSLLRGKSSKSSKVASPAAATPRNVSLSPIQMATVEETTQNSGTITSRKSAVGTPKPPASPKTATISAAEGLSSSISPPQTASAWGTPKPSASSSVPLPLTTEEPTSGLTGATKSPWGTPKPSVSPSVTLSPTTEEPTSGLTGATKSPWGTPKPSASPSVTLSPTTEEPTSGLTGATKSPWGTLKPSASSSVALSPTIEEPTSGLTGAPKSPWGTPKPPASLNTATPAAVAASPSDAASPTKPAWGAAGKSPWGTPKPAATPKAGSKLASKVPTPQAATPNPSSPQETSAELPPLALTPEAALEKEEHKDETADLASESTPAATEEINETKPDEAPSAELTKETETEVVEGEKSPDAPGENPETAATATTAPDYAPGTPGDGLNGAEVDGEGAAEGEGDEKEKEEEEEEQTAKKKGKGGKGATKKKKKK